MATAQEPPFVLRSETSAVQINVGVKDRDGLPIRGLRKEDFNVFDNGRSQPIQFFSSDNMPAGESETAPGHSPVMASRLIALVLDGLNTEFIDQSYMRDQAFEAVKQMGSNESLAVLTLVPGLPFQSFTRSRDRLLAAINAFHPNVPPYPMKRRIQVTLAALKTLSDHMKQGPGRKSILWMTGGFPEIRAYDRVVQKTLDQINASNVAIYPIMRAV
ncbi:MAG TPA: VWA domain-containing protein [Bryobacteraceae bacterium]|nr:VWA domain-containing protein [Bryobacteraceae bacterium]